MNLYKDPFQRFTKHHEQELRGTEGMKVSLVSWSTNPYEAIALGQTASFRPWKMNFTPEEIIKLLDDMAAGKVWAGQAFEALNFTFLIENITRATTHQLVRVRIGAGFMQESGREGTWDKAPFVTPLTILEDGTAHSEYVHAMQSELALYRVMVDTGIATQDARMVVGHGIAQNMWMTINFRSLMEWCGKRLCTTMQWEINALARMIRDEVIKKYPHLGVLLKSHCEKRGGCKSITAFYEVGAQNNGSKIFHPFEGNLCGKQSGIFSEDDIINMLAEERYCMKQGKEYLYVEKL